MARKKKPVPVSVLDWCSCSEWKEHQWRLTNHEKMNFCVFCGKKLEKERKA